MKKLNKILSILLVVMFIFVGCTTPGIIEPTTEPTSEITTEIVEPTSDIIISKEVKDLAKDTKEEVENGEFKDSVEIPEADVLDEMTLENELEPDGTIEIENISWDGTNTGKGLSLLGKYQGITYYSQADPRWANIMYSSIHDKNQTIKSSGCGPTSAAMIVSSSKGVIIPPTMAKLFVNNGFRTANNGTAWSVWPFIADFFEFKDYVSTSNINTLIKYLSKDENKDGKADYFAVASCGPGLFTTSGHYIAIMGVINDSFEVFDPYYYAGKFNTASRRAAKVIMKGNAAFVTTKNAHKYANFKHFWIFSNDYVKPSKVIHPTRYVSTKGKINIYATPASNTKPLGTYVNGKKVKVYQTKNGFSRVGKNKWVRSKFLVKKSKLINYKTVVGKTYTLKKKTNLYSKGTLKGKEYTYKAGAKIVVLRHYDTKVDKVKVIKTGRKAYTRVKNFN